MLDGAVTSKRTLPQWHPPVWGIMCCLCCDRWREAAPGGDGTAKLDTRHFRDLTNRHSRALRIVPARAVYRHFARRAHAVIPGMATYHHSRDIHIPSFPRRRESILWPCKSQWIPAFADTVLVMFWQVLDGGRNVCRIAGHQTSSARACA